MTIRPIRAAGSLRTPSVPSIPDSSTRSVHRVVRFDGRTKIVALRRPGGEWLPCARVEVFSRDAAKRLKAEGYSEVELRRRLARARIPLLWVTGRVES
jgi:hypothetical protein